jgi:ABC-type microcin C transport system permease subunit YejE
MLPLVSAGMAEYVRGTKASSQTPWMRIAHLIIVIVKLFLRLLMKCY